MSERGETAKDSLNGRALAYQRVFDPANRDVQLILKDLMKFCRAMESTFHPDARLAAQLDGRREVFLRVMQHTKLSQDQLWVLLGVPPPKG